MSKITILLDMDETVYDHHTPWLAWYNEKWNDNKTTADIVGWEWEFVKPEARGKVYEHIGYEGTFINLKPFEGAVDAIGLVHSWGVRQVFASTCKTKTGPYEKQQAVQRDFPFIGSKNVIITGGEKGVLKGDLLVDDGPHNLAAFAAEGGTTCRAEVNGSPYTRLYANPDYTLSHWSQYPEIVRNLIKKLRS